MKYIRKEIRIQRQDRQLVGTAYLPQTGVPVPTVIFSHGYNGSGDDFASNSEYLAEKGIASFCLDFCGGSVKSRSQGQTREMTIFSETEDLCAVLKETEKWKWVKSGAVFLFGGSQGGFVSALTAEALGDKVRGMILLFPAFCIADNWNKRFLTMEEIPETIEFWGMTLGKPFFETLQGYSVFDHIGSYEGNVLILHGDRDQVVDLSYSQKAAALYPHGRLIIFPGEGHGFSEDGARSVPRITLEFIQESLDKKNQEQLT